MAPKNHYGRFGPFGSRLEKIDKKGKPVVYIRSHTAIKILVATSKAPLQ